MKTTKQTTSNSNQPKTFWFQNKTNSTTSKRSASSQKSSDLYKCIQNIAKSYHGSRKQLRTPETEVDGEQGKTCADWSWDMAGTQIEDVGASQHPLMLHPLTDSQTEVTLQQTLSAWSQNDGMCRVLLQALTCLYQFERLSNVQGLRRRSCKLIIDNMCEVPVFFYWPTHWQDPNILVCLRSPPPGSAIWSKPMVEVWEVLERCRPISSAKWALSQLNGPAQCNISGLRVFTGP